MSRQIRSAAKAEAAVVQPEYAQSRKAAAEICPPTSPFEPAPPLDANPLLRTLVRRADEVHELGHSRRKV